ncbi:MAG: tetratricopeptide repeat protein [Planctomycetota bacterium]|nr:tetratricopeptide repeat protein [Planctomycetota bacterium]
MSTNINKLIERGEDALKKKNFDYAIEVLLQAVSFAPNNRRAREALRKAELKKHEHSYPSGFAVAIFGLPAKIGMFFAGLGKKGNPESYMMACEKFLTLDPKSKKVNMLLGDCAAQAGHLETAVFAFETASEHHPDDVTAMKKHGQLLWKSGEILKAHAVYDRVVKIDPKDQEAVKARKNLAAEASLKETGFETARSSQDLIKDKDKAGELEQSERMYRSADDLTTQRAAIEQRLADDPDNMDLYLDLSEVCERMKDWEAALGAYDEAIKKKPQDASLQFGRDDVEIKHLESDHLAAVQAGKTNEADLIERKLKDVKTVAFRKRVKAYPTDLNLRFSLGDLLLARGDIEEAIGEFQQTVRDPKFRSESQLRLGKAFRQKNQFDLAVRQLTQALEGQSGMTERVKEIRYTLGDVFQLKGDGGAAKEQFSMIYEVDIGFRDVGDRLAKLESGASEGTLSLDD